MILRAVVVGSALLLAGTVRAEPAARPQPVLRRVPIQTPPAATPASRIIFVHRCPSTGCLIRPGTDDSRTDTSSIPTQQVSISRFKQTDAVWAKMMECVKNTYAPFDITVTDVDPGPTVSHYENVVGGSSGSELHPDFAGAGGVSPFTCGEIPNSISFTFDVYGPDADQLCWTVAQETAHSFGLEHEYNASDPLTYIGGGPSMKRFQPTESPCGTFQALSSCSCTQKATQNSFRFLSDMFGKGVATPPTVSIKAPSSGSKVQPKFVVRVIAMDDSGVKEVQLFIDGIDTGVRAITAPYLLTAPDTLDEGPHTVEVRAFDVQSVPASATIDVELGPPCTQSSGCSGDDVCVGGTCVPGPDVPGGLGDSCTAPTECLAGQCVGDAKHKQCVESCDLGAANACPNDFSCIAAGANGVCWYDGSSGCCSAGTEPTAPILLGASVLGLVLSRRRRRRSPRSGR
ncbi:hypothetical protein BH11MYX3_BH11MYX3_38010 [soil metagenome]